MRPDDCLGAGRTCRSMLMGGVVMRRGLRGKRKAAMERCVCGGVGGRWLLGGWRSWLLCETGAGVGGGRSMSGELEV